MARLCGRSARVSWRTLLLVLGACVVGAAAFDLAYSQMPLYDGNYNSYALHGLALAGEGELRHDWAAQTTDAFPVVSGLVALVHLSVGDGGLHVLHALLFAVFLAAVLSIGDSLFGLARSRAALATFGAAVILVHSILFRRAIAWLTGGDWGWYAQAGLAEQYVLGYVLQPSLFGVLLVASIATFLRGRDRTALSLAACAALCHAGYFLAAMLLVAGYGVARATEAEPGARLRAAAKTWALGAVLLGAVALFVAWRFAPSSAESLARAHGILVEQRIPHHALLRRWLHRSGIIQLALIAIGLAIARWRRSALFAIVGVAVLGAATLTGAVAISGSRSVALLFPWRVSIVIVPIATATILGALARFLVARPRAARVAAVASLGLVVAAVATGLTKTLADAREYASDPELPAMLFARTHRASGQLYVVPDDLQRFRLETGAPTFVDWKTHPYKDDEVVAWFARVTRVRHLFASKNEAFCEEARALVRDEHVTHFVVPAGEQHCDDMREVFADDTLTILEVPAP
jgi:hypothetical protein